MLNHIICLELTCKLTNHFHVVLLTPSGISGAPEIVAGEIQDPLKKNKFDISFVGNNGEEVTSKVKIARKIWFSGSTM